MFRKTRLAVTTGVLGAALLATTVSGAGAGSNAVGVRGSFESTPPFGGPDCPSPINLCATGSFSGVLNGPATASARSLIPTSQPDVYLGLADVVIFDNKGEVHCTETFVLNLAPGGDSEEGWICRVTGGTGVWANATGHIEGFGSTPPGSLGAGRYEGKLRRSVI